MRGVDGWVWYLRTKTSFVTLEGMMQVRVLFDDAERCGRAFRVTVAPHAGTAGGGGAVTGGGGGRGTGGGGGKGGSAAHSDARQGSGL
jgi:hypothetical protein